VTSKTAASKRRWSLTAHRITPWHQHRQRFDEHSTDAFGQRQVSTMLQAVESVPCGAGLAPNFWQESRRPPAHLCAVYKPARWCRSVPSPTMHPPTHRSPSITRACFRRHHLIQSHPRHGPGRRRHGGRAGHARDWLASAIRGRLQGRHRHFRFPRQSTHADRCALGGGLYCAGCPV